MAESERLLSSSKSSSPGMAPSPASAVSPGGVTLKGAGLTGAGAGGGGGGGKLAFGAAAGGAAFGPGTGGAPGMPGMPGIAPGTGGWPGAPSAPGMPPYMASRSMMSRRSALPSINSSRQTVSASKVSGPSHNAPIISSRPASMRLAMAISPSRDSSSTDPISRRYMRTGSSVRSYCSPDFPVVASALLPEASTRAPPSSPSSASSLSMTL